MSETHAYIRVPYRAAFDHAQGDELAVDVAMVTAWVDDRLRRQRENPEGARRKQYPCASWVREGLGWSWKRTRRALERAEHLGVLRGWDAPIEWSVAEDRRSSSGRVWQRKGDTGARMARRYSVNVGAWNEYVTDRGWFPLERRFCSGSALRVAALLVHGFEHRANQCIESTTSELAGQLGCTPGYVRRLKRDLRRAGLLEETTRPAPGRRFARLTYSAWLGRELDVLDYLGARMQFPTDHKAKASWSRQLLSIRDQLNRHMDGAAVLRRAALELERRTGEVPTAKQVARWVARRYAHLLEGHENAARELVQRASIARDPAVALRRLAGLKRAAAALAGAPPG